MRNINFDDGYKSFSINGDENRVIRFNPGDPNLQLRTEEAQKHIEAWKSELEGVKIKPDGTPEGDTEEASKILMEFNTMLHDELNYIFNADVYDKVFAGQSPLCIVGEKKQFLFEAFLVSAFEIIEEEVKEFNTASRARIHKYTKEYHK